METKQHTLGGGEQLGKRESQKGICKNTWDEQKWKYNSPQLIEYSKNKAMREVNSIKHLH